MTESIQQAPPLQLDGMDPVYAGPVPLNPEELARVEQGMSRLRELSDIGMTSEGSALAGLGAEMQAIYDDPDRLVELQGALLVWGDTPYVDGSRGENGAGTNGGVEHFFAYRLDPNKSVRWQAPGMEDYSATLEGFIQLSADLFEAVNHPEESDKTKMAYDMTDESGNTRRMGNFVGNNQYVSFRHNGESHFRISSLYNIKDISTIRPMVEKATAKWSAEKENNYINQLTSKPKLVRSYKK